MEAQAQIRQPPAWGSEGGDTGRDMGSGWGQCGHHSHADLVSFTQDPGERALIFIQATDGETKAQRDEKTCARSHRC